MGQRMKFTMRIDAYTGTPTQNEVTDFTALVRNVTAVGLEFHSDLGAMHVEDEGVYHFSECSRHEQTEMDFLPLKDLTRHIDNWCSLCADRVILVEMFSGSSTPISLVTQASLSGLMIALEQIPQEEDGDVNEDDYQGYVKELVSKSIFRDAFRQAPFHYIIEPSQKFNELKALMEIPSLTEVRKIIQTKYYATAVRDQLGAEMLNGDKVSTIMIEPERLYPVDLFTDHPSYRELIKENAKEEVQLLLLSALIPESDWVETESRIIISMDSALLPLFRRQGYDVLQVAETPEDTQAHAFHALVKLHLAADHPDALEQAKKTLKEL